MVFTFFWVFCTSLGNQVEQIWLKSQLICNYKWAKIIFVDKGLDSKLQHCGPCKIPWKKIKTSHSDHSGHFEDGIMQNQEENKIKCKTMILWAKQTSFLPPCLSACGKFHPHGYMYEFLTKYRKNELNP
jgi:hypothetical protein